MKPKKDKGFTLIETVGMIVLVSIIFLGLLAAYNSLTYNAARSERQGVALLLAQKKLEEVYMKKAVPQGYDKIKTGIDQKEEGAFEDDFKGYSYTIESTYKDYNGKEFTPSEIDKGYKLVTVTVAGSTATAKLSTIISRYGELD
ncbi:MAG: type II secretion system protein [bacterium]